MKLIFGTLDKSQNVDNTVIRNNMRKGAINIREDRTNGQKEYIGEMKKTPLMLVFGIHITLLFLQLSCGTVEKYRAYETPAEIEETPEEALLLAYKHKSAGIE